MIKPQEENCRAKAQDEAVGIIEDITAKT